MKDVILIERPHPFPLPLYREGKVGMGHGQMGYLTHSRLWEGVGRGQNERNFWEGVGRGGFAIDK